VTPTGMNQGKIKFMTDDAIKTGTPKDPRLQLHLI
jgi:hypothetical protein